MHGCAHVTKLNSPKQFRQWQHEASSWRTWSIHQRDELINLMLGVFNIPICILSETWHFGKPVKLSAFPHSKKYWMRTWCVQYYSAEVEHVLAEQHCLVLLLCFLSVKLHFVVCLISPFLAARGWEVLFRNSSSLFYTKSWKACWTKTKEDA